MSGPIAMDGPLSSYTAGFHAELLAKGYCGRTAGRQLMGVVPTPVVAVGPVEQLVAGYRQYLVVSADWTRTRWLSTGDPTVSVGNRLERSAR